MVEHKRELEPALTLQVPKEYSKPVLGQKGNVSNISSVCFLHPSKNGLLQSPENELEEHSDYSEEDEYDLRCSNLSTMEVAVETQRSAFLWSLCGSLLATSHASGECLLWDVHQRKVLQPFCEKRGPGLSVQRCLGDNLCYQTRDRNGIVSLHDPHVSDNTRGMKEVCRFETKSETFCSVAVPRNSLQNDSSSLVALPVGGSRNNEVAVRDWRIPATASPVLQQAVGEKHQQSSMLTSLSLCNDANDRRWLVCGMENGLVVTYDMAKPNKPFSLKLSREPVLSLDSVAAKAGSGIITVAGMAGDAMEQSELLSEDRGPVAVLKTVKADEDGLSTHLRSRIPTCRVGTPDACGKPGVNVCRFRPDGRIFAVGGWDRRLRLFSRSSEKPLAILRGNTAAITTVDWKPDSDWGTFVTGSADGQLSIWRCFENTG